MPPADAQRPRRKPRRRPAPKPSAQNAAAYVSQGKAVERAANQQKRRPRRSTPNPLINAARSAPAGSLTRTPGITSRTGSPAPRPQTASQTARSARFEHVSQGRSVERQARSQQRRAYTSLPLAERRHALSVVRHIIKTHGDLSPLGVAADQVHHERHMGDVAAKRETGGILPRELLNLPAGLDLRLASLAPARGMMNTVAVNKRQQRQQSLDDLTDAALTHLDKLANPKRADHDTKPKFGDPDWQPDTSIAHVPGANFNPEAKARPGEKHMKFTGETKVAGVAGIPFLHQGAWTAGRVLEQVSRPLHGVAGGLKAAQEGDDVLNAVGRGLANKDKYTFGDLPSVKSIQNPVARTAAALGGDILGDPLNLVTFGASAPADALLAASRQAQRLSEAADAAGNGVKAAKLAARSRQLAIRASEAPTNRGIQLGLKSPVGARGRALRTSGTASAHMANLLRLPHTGKAIRQTAPAQALGKALVPGFRPAGVDAQEWENAIAAERSGRAETRTGLRAAEDLGKGFHVAIKNAAKDRGLHPSDVGRQVLDAIETNTIGGLPGSLRPVAEEFQRRMGAIADEERKAGVLNALRSNYVPHQWEQTVSGRSTADRITGSNRNVFSDKRSIEGTIEQVNRRAAADGLDPIFSTNVPGLAALRAGKSAKVLGHAKFQARIVNDGVARHVTDARKYSAAHPGDFLYEMKPGGMTAIEDPKGGIDWAAAEQKIRDGKQVVGMNKIIGDRYTKGFGKIVTTEGPTFGRGVDRFMSGLKTALTVLNIPAYDMRNLTGDSFNAYLADTSVADIKDAARAISVQQGRQRAGRELGTYATNKTLKIGGERVNIAEALSRAEKSGAINTGYVGGEKFEVERGTQAQGLRTQFGGVRNAIRPVDRLRSVGQVREDFIRFGTWLGAKRRGMSDEEAGQWANMHHFDYADLTDAERGVLRRVFPFYTFAARNTRLQVKKLLTNPGKYANYQAFREEMAKQAGLGPDWEHHLEPYQQRGAGIPFQLPGQKGASMAYPALPLTDLSRLGALTSPKDEGDLVMQMLNPLIKAPVEALQNYSFFFKGPIWRDAKNPDARHWVPAPPQLAQVPGLRNALGMKLIPDKTNHNKPTWMMTAKADYLLRQLPQSNFAVQALTPATGSHGQSSHQSIVSQLTGVKLGDYDRNTVELRNAQKHMAELRVKQKDLGDTGADRSPGGGHYSKAYRKVLDEISGTQKRIDKLKKKKGYAPPKKPVRKPRKSGGSGIYGAGGGGSVYGAPASGSLYGAP